MVRDQKFGITANDTKWIENALEILNLVLQYILQCYNSAQTLNYEIKINLVKVSNILCHNFRHRVLFFFIIYFYKKIKTCSKCFRRGILAFISKISK